MVQNFVQYHPHHPRSCQGQGHRLRIFMLKFYLKVFWTSWQPSWLMNCDHLYKFLKKISQGFQRRSFKGKDRRMANDHNSSYWAFSSGELKMENVNLMLSVFCHYIFRPNDMERFWAVSLLSLPSCKLSGEIESRKLANTGKFALFVHLQASSEILWMLISALKSQLHNFFSKLRIFSYQQSIWKVRNWVTLGQKLGYQVKSKENLVNTLEVKFLK